MSRWWPQMDDDIMDQIRVDTFQRYLRVQTIGPSKLIGHRRSEKGKNQRFPPSL